MEPLPIRKGTIIRLAICGALIGIGFLALDLLGLLPRL